VSTPLDGIRVIEIANFAAAPCATAIMADLGAEVIKVEAIGGDPIRMLMKQPRLPEGEHNPDYPFQFINRGKRSIEVNLDDDRGVEIATALIKNADVVVTNLLPARRARFGLDFDDLFAIKPDLVIGALSGYGEQGDETNRPGFDVTAFFARSGVSGGGTAPGGNPPHARPAQGDHTTGMALFGGLMAGLRARDQTGEGQVIEVSLLRAATWTIALDLQNSLVDGRPAYDRPRENAVSAMIEAFECSDGRWIQFAMPDAGDAWLRFVAGVDRPDLLDVPEYATARDRFQNMSPLLETLGETFAARPSAEWIVQLDEHKCVFALVNTSADAIVDPQVRATGAFEKVQHPKVGEFETIGAPFRMPLNPEVGVRGPAPERGADTDELVGAALNLNEDQLAHLADEGVIGRG
jgi:crotonobetainyl-CoA:carnitine CoA-transferase CaiB-like acyl-CoA transferase